MTPRQEEEGLVVARAVAALVEGFKALGWSASAIVWHATERIPVSASLIVRGPLGARGGLRFEGLSFATDPGRLHALLEETAAACAMGETKAAHEAFDQAWGQGTTEATRAQLVKWAG